MTAPDGVTVSLADWAARSLGAELPTEVRDVVLRHLVDHVGNVVAGAVSDPATPALSTVRAGRDGEGAVATGVGTVAPADAAWCNGLSAHCLDLDDGFTPGGLHPGSVVFPAVLAAAAGTRAGGDEVVEAAAVGLETACRIAAAGHPVLRERGLHSTGTAGVFGAAAGVARLRGAAPAVVASALGIAGSHAAGLMAFLGGGEGVKAVHAGRAARDGLLSADLAVAGVGGPADVLESPHGYFAVLAGDAALADHVLADRGESWLLRGLYLKPFPGCRDAHGPVEAALELRRTYAITPDDVEHIRVTTLSRVAAHDAGQVDSTLRAQLSIPFNVSVALADGCLTLRQFDPAHLADPQVRAVAERCEVVGSTELDALFPNARPSVVELTLRDGRRLVRRIDHPLGEPARPLSDGGLRDKFRGSVTPVLGDRPAGMLLAACRDADLRTLTQILATVPRRAARHS